MKLLIKYVIENLSKFKKATKWQRFAAIVTFAVIVYLVVPVIWSAYGDYDLGKELGPCGFQQCYHLPCPGCGITSSAIAFFSGKILKSFWIQPAGAIFCCGLLITAFFTFITGVFGVYFAFLDGFWFRVKLKYIFFVVFIVVLGGWAVTLSRALAAKS